MPHGTVRIGDIEVTALCDVLADFPQPFSRAFPTIPEDRRAEFVARHPEAFSGPDTWLLHDHCYLVRTSERLILVDTGVGGNGTLGVEWIKTEGGLPAELEQVGVASEDVDVVVITHAHLDHIGWNLVRDGDGGDGGAARPRFANARYAVQRAEWEGFVRDGDEFDRKAFEQSLRPLESLGVLQLVDDGERVADGVTLRLAPGHTPGHQVVALESGGERAVLSGDLANHPAQVTEPAWVASGDLDPEGAAVTRARWLDTVEEWNATLCTAHFPQPFGRLAREDGRRVWRPS